jgi:hypothetical protein
MGSFDLVRPSIWRDCVLTVVLCRCEERPRNIAPDCRPRPCSKALFQPPAPGKSWHAVRPLCRATRCQSRPSLESAPFARAELHPNGGVALLGNVLRALVDEKNLAWSLNDVLNMQILGCKMCCREVVWLRIGRMVGSLH